MTWSSSPKSVMQCDIIQNKGIPSLTGKSHFDSGRPFALFCGPAWLILYIVTGSCSAGGGRGEGRGGTPCGGPRHSEAPPKRGTFFGM